MQINLKSYVQTKNYPYDPLSPNSQREPNLLFFRILQ